MTLVAGGASRQHRGMSTPTVPAASRGARTGTEWALLGLEILLAVGAYGGALWLISGAGDFGEATADLPFGSAVFAGWALLVVNGVLPTVVVIGALWRRVWAKLGHLVVGAALIAWVALQVSLLGWPPAGLQVIYFLWGWAILLLGVQHYRTTR